MSSVKCWWPTLMIGIMHENHALLLNKGPTIEIWVRVLSQNSSQTPVLYFSKSTFLTFSSQIPTNSVNLTRFLPFPYMRNIEYLRGTLSSHENYHIPTMRNGKTTEILSSLLWDSHKIRSCTHEFQMWRRRCKQSDPHWFQGHQMRFWWMLSTMSWK